MDKPKISIIVAIGAHNRVIGKDNALPWRIKADMEHFKSITMGHPVIMGRNTWESIPERFRPLEGRTNVIVTSNPDYIANGAYIAKSLDRAIEYAISIDTEEIFIIGGATIYAQALPVTDKLYLTLVEGNYNGDTFFPNYSDFERETSRQNHEENGIKFSFVEIEKS